MQDRPATPLHLDARRELLEHILPFWSTRAVDHVRGGFVGRIDGHGTVHPDAPRGVVLNARILWTFAAAARAFGQPEHAALARRACGALSTHFADDAHGGVYWTVSAEGRPLDTKKQVYAQAFTVYALAEYVRLTDDEGALDRAKALFALLEARTTDAVCGGYYEAFARDWAPLTDVRLSEKDEVAPKSMNTHLHVMEAYTNLYRVWPDPALRARLAALVGLFLDRIVDEETAHQRGFFAADWTPTSGVVSFGHDVEASWLLVEAAEVVGDAHLLARTRPIALRMAAAVLDEGVDPDGGVLNEAIAGKITDADKHWWPQAEAIVGFLNAHALSGDARFLAAAERTWGFIQRTIATAESGEWRFRVSRAGVPYRDEDTVGLWKCPYHNSRACLETLARTSPPPGNAEVPASEGAAVLASSAA